MKLYRTAKDLSGKRYGKLVAVKPVERRDRHILWLCKCDCGKTKIASTKCLGQGSTKSCGCLSEDHWWNRKHGKFGTQVYQAWASMIKRCKVGAIYHRKGILVCSRWKRFELFYEDMGEPTSEKHSIDRIDNKKGYFKKNCRWATRKEQQRNRDYCVFLTIEGKRLHLFEWAELVGKKPATIRGRIKRGVSPREAVYGEVLRPKMYNINGKRKTLSEWCMKLGVKRVTVRRRLSAGWPIKKAFTGSLQQISWKSPNFS